MKYVANPVVVDAFQIVRVQPNSDGGYHVWLDNDSDNNATPDMCARMIPAPGDYWVMQSDGYMYLNPREVFERKYSPQSQKEQHVTN